MGMPSLAATSARKVHLTAHTMTLLSNHLEEYREAALKQYRDSKVIRKRKGYGRVAGGFTAQSSFGPSNPSLMEPISAETRRSAKSERYSV